jgi:hypothetical protein
LADEITLKRFVFWVNFLNLSVLPADIGRNAGCYLPFSHDRDETAARPTTMALVKLFTYLV